MEWTSGRVFILHGGGPERFMRADVFQVLLGKFESSLKQLEVGEGRLQTCRDLCAQLIDSNHPQTSLIREKVQKLRCIRVMSSFHVQSDMFVRTSLGPLVHPPPDVLPAPLFAVHAGRN